MKRKIKVLYIHHGKVLGGAPVSLLNTILGLKREGSFDAKILCAHREMQDFFRENSGIEVGSIYNPCLILGRVFIGMSSLLNPRTIARCVYELLLLPLSITMQLIKLKNEAPDIVHLNSSILISTAIAASLARIPVVWHVREVITGGRFSIRKRFVSYLICALSETVVAISPFEAENLCTRRKGNVRIVYNFIDFKKFDQRKNNPASGRQRLGISNDDMIVLSLGGVSFRKGTVQIIESAQFTDDNVKYIFAGPPPSPGVRPAGRDILINTMLCLEDWFVKTKLKTHCAWFYQHRVSNALSAVKTRTTHKITFIGHTKDIAPIIASCDILVFAGTTPHFPRPIYEAWAMKKPVIAFDMGGISCNIEDGVDGIIVRQRNGKALAEAIKGLLRSRDMMRSMGSCGQIKARQRFSLDKNMSEIISIYNNIVKGYPPPQNLP
jgi:glycosyltransferase involved in cell wall biosynthesis